MAGGEGSPAAAKSAMDGSRKEQQDKMPACGEAWYSTTQAQLLDLLWNILFLSLSLSLSLSLVYAASALQQKAAGRKSMLL